MSEMKPGISVVIPTYNRANDLQRALKSLQGQTFTAWEAIIVDNYSKDNTDEIIARFNDPRMSVYKNHNNGIIAVSRNFGIQKAKADYIAFLDSDDWWMPEKLEKSLYTLNNGSDFIYHDLLIVNKKGIRKHAKTVGALVLKKPVFENLLKSGNAIPNSSVVIRTELLRAVNGLSEDPLLVTAEDFDCWLRVAKITDRFTCMPGLLGYYWQGNNESQNPKILEQVSDRLDSLYFNSPITTNIRERPNWLLYNKARAAYLRGQTKESKRLIKILRKRSLPWELKLKLYFMLLNLRNGLFLKILNLLFRYHRN